MGDFDGDGVKFGADGFGKFAEDRIALKAFERAKLNRAIQTGEQKLCISGV